MTIESLDPADKEVAALIARSDAFYRDLYPPESNHLEDEQALKRDNVLFVGYRSDGRLVACGAAKLMQDDGAYAEIKRVFVDQSHRGRGLSLKIMDYLEAELARRGVQLLRLETGIKQPEALRLYDKLGYQRRGPYGAYGPDPYSVFMEKKLPIKHE